MEDEKEDTRRLLARRAAYKGNITRLHRRVSSGSLQGSLQLLLLLEEKALTTYSEYESTNLELGELAEDPETTETMYFECLAGIRERLAVLVKQRPDSGATSTPGASATTKLKLPHVEMPTFDGKYSEYKPFVEMFTAFIDNDKNLSDIQKFFYLRGFLKSEAYDLVKNLPVVGSSYKEALSILSDRYDKKQKIVNEHISALLDLPVCNKASAASLRTLISSVKQHLAALKNLGEPVSKWDSILVCMLTRKLDLQTRNAYHLALNQTTPILSTNTAFIQFIESRAMALESDETSRCGSTGASGKVATNVVNVVKEASCIFCGKSHKLYTCPAFMLASLKDRLTFVNNKKLCKICLNAHANKCKFHFRCATCKGAHNSLIHQSEQEQPCKEPVINTNVVNTSANKVTQVLLPTAKVKLISHNGEEIIVKALLDSASQSSFITSSLARAIGKKPIPNPLEVVGIANTGKTVRHALQLDIFSCAYPYKVRPNLLLVDQITSKLPQCPIDLEKIKLPSNIKLADDSFNITSEIDILLGADVFFQALLPQDDHIQLMQDEVNGDAAQPRLLHTQFGYIVAGTVPDSSKQSSAVALFCQECESDLSATMSQFWQAEKVPEKFVEPTSEQQYVEKYFTDTVKLENNQFEVSIPLKLPLSDMNDALGESLGLALKRFLNLENKFQKDKQLHKEYKSFIHEYLELGHASFVDITLYDLSKDPIYFFAHHAVIKHDAITTKLRTVFDGSMKTNNKISLNNLMLNGAIPQQELFDILLLFRLHKYFFVCDIKRMFRNIIIEKSQRSLLNILWRDSPDEQIKCIQLSTLPYGLKCSSWLATRCLQELVTQFGEQYPLAAPVLLNSTYVDDVLHTDSSLARIIETKSQLTELLSKGSFQLHKWSANHKAILTEVPEQQQNSEDLGFNRDLKTLGLKFDIQQDCFRIVCPPACDVPKTKRQILSYISQFFDPIGLAGPAVSQCKMVMRRLWGDNSNNNKSWDAVLSPKLQKEWLQLYNSLQQMAQVTAPRNVCPENSKTIQIIGFSDAAIEAMGCAVYLRVVDRQGSTTVSLLCSKSKIAPKANKLSIPRLELNAALLLAKLSARAHDTLSKKIQVDSVYLYTDSQVVLAWLATDLAMLNTYVANRIKVINELTMSFDWGYVASESNPADFLTKPYSPTELQGNQLWWTGPPFLKEPNYSFKKFSYESTKNLPEVKIGINSKLVCAASQEKPKSFLDLFIEQYSDINKLVNILAYLFRFTNNLKTGSNKIKEDFIMFAEASKALRVLIRNEQERYFPQDMALLKAGKPTLSHLKSLNPFIDAEGILRVGGRLQHSALPYSHKHQIILPKESTVTHLLIQNEHLKLLHSGQKLVLSSLQQRYWIVNGLRLVKKFVHKCMTCFRHKGVTAKQLMGSLPADRVNITRCFQKVGIDFAGPVALKQSRIRGVITSRGYICLFVDFLSHGIHVELVSNLETKTFIAALKRFIARRNVPSEIYCDNAGTFKAANTQLTELYKLNSSRAHQAQVQAEASKLGITFKFVPSYSPVFAGLAEAAVKSTKSLLKRVLGSHVLTYEELYTVLVQIEGILNSRPITPMSSDTEDLSYLTPGHFLTGAPLNCIPEQDLTDIPENRLNFWRKCTAIQQHFWRYWSRHYLNVLQNRPKWKESQPNVKVGALVILRELAMTPPMAWPMARVTRVFKGADGLVRALEVKKANGRVHRTSITKICILPIE